MTLSIVEVRPSDIHGVGVFATTTIAPFTKLGPALSQDLRDTTMNNPDLVFSSLGWLVITWPIGRFMNHAADPNCEIGINEAGNKFNITTLRGINQFDELTINYAEIYGLLGWTLDFKP